MPGRLQPEHVADKISHDAIQRSGDCPEADEPFFADLVFGEATIAGNFFGVKWENCVARLFTERFQEPAEVPEILFFSAEPPFDDGKDSRRALRTFGKIGELVTVHDARLAADSFALTVPTFGLVAGVHGFRRARGAHDGCEGESCDFAFHDGSPW